MTHKFGRAIVAATAIAMIAGTAYAQSMVAATTDLNVRAGPGPGHPVIGVIGAGQTTTLNGCLENGKWCSVSTSKGEGWVYSDYLTGEFGGKQVVLTERPADSGVTVLKDKGGGDSGAVAGGVTGAIAGALIAGPVGAAVGGAAGAVAGGAAGTVIDPPEKVRTYVTTNKVDPVYLEGEVVVGAGLPETVELREIPDYEYRYVYVNGQPVLVDATTRRIVHIVR
jgi:uncharacterized protein YraI